MKAKYDFNTNQLDKFDLTISITMTVEQWRAVMRIRAENYHNSHGRLQNIISQALGDFTNATSKTYEIEQ